MRRHHSPCFVPRGQTESFQSGNLKLFIIWCPAVVSWGKHLLLQLLKTCLITAHPITGSVWAFCLKCFQLLKSAQILAAPNSWLWDMLVKSQKQGAFHSPTCSLEWLGFLCYVRFGEIISWNGCIWKWEKKPVLFMFSNSLNGKWLKIHYLSKTTQNGNIQSTAGRINNSRAVMWLNLLGGFFDGKTIRMILRRHQKG